MRNFKFLTSAIVTMALLTATSAWAVKHVNVKVPVDKRGMTSEQKNIADQVITANKPGAIKHFYVISAYSGDVIIYSTVRGKVTSSGKRLQPKTVLAANGNRSSYTKGIILRTDSNKKQYTSELMQDDGTYGSSIPYLFWYDTAGRYHKHYVSGGQIIHVSDQPLQVGQIIINMELVK